MNFSAADSVSLSLALSLCRDKTPNDIALSDVRHEKSSV